MGDCPFCQNSSTFADEVLASNDFCYIIEAPEAAVRGLMIIPFRHVETPFELTAEEWAALQPLVHTGRKLLGGDDPMGSTSVGTYTTQAGNL